MDASVMSTHYLSLRADFQQNYRGKTIGVRAKLN
jgi:hypothetical protein